MKITVYELLGLIKDGKAPKRIKEIFNDGYKEEYVLDDEGWYMTIDETTKMNIFRVERLNDEVEIIEDEKPTKENNKIKKIKTLNNVGNSNDLGEFKDKQRLNNHILKDKINELIDVINERSDKNE